MAHALVARASVLRLVFRPMSCGAGAGGGIDSLGLPETHEAATEGSPLQTAHTLVLQHGVAVPFPTLCCVLSQRPMSTILVLMLSASAALSSVPYTADTSCVCVCVVRHGRYELGLV